MGDSVGREHQRSGVVGDGSREVFLAFMFCGGTWEGLETDS